MLAVIADVLWTPERAGRPAHRHDRPPTPEVIAVWRDVILRDHDTGRPYALQLIAHVDIHGGRVPMVPEMAGGRTESALLAAIA